MLTCENEPSYPVSIFLPMPSLQSKSGGFQTAPEMRSMSQDTLTSRRETPWPTCLSSALSTLLSIRAFPGGCLQVVPGAWPCPLAQKPTGCEAADKQRAESGCPSPAPAASSPPCLPSASPTGRHELSGAFSWALHGRAPLKASLSFILSTPPPTTFFFFLDMNSIQLPLKNRPACHSLFASWRECH